MKVYKLTDAICNQYDTAHYDMSVSDGKLTDVSGKRQRCNLTILMSKAVATYGKEVYYSLIKMDMQTFRQD
ncbi:MAG: hypothetical protein ACLUD0_07350 [Eubacterium ramulus]